MIGEWSYHVAELTKDKRKRGFVISDDKGRRVCENFGTDPPFAPEEKRRIGQLISAAPDLLIALKQVIDYGLNRKTMELAIRALEKARPQPKL